MTHHATSAFLEFTAQATAQGWVPNPDLPEEGPEVVPVWLYSFGLNSGCRLIAQMFKDVYEHGLPSAILTKTEAHPGAIYKGAASQFDLLPDNLKLGSEVQQDLTVKMFAYVLSTKLWAALPLARSVTGIHVVMADWCDTRGTHILVGSAILQRHILTPDQITEAGVATIRSHVTRYPSDKPQGW